MENVSRKSKPKKKPGLQGSSDPKVKSLVSKGNSPATALPFFTPDQVKNPDVHRSSKAKKTKKHRDWWESTQVVDPNNPTAIRLILKRVRGPQLSQQATQCPGLSQNAMQQRHGEGRASQVPGSLPCNLSNGRPTQAVGSMKHKREASQIEGGDVSSFTD